MNPDLWLAVFCFFAVVAMVAFPVAVPVIAALVMAAAVVAFMAVRL